MVFFVRKFAKMPKIKLERQYSVAKLPNFETRFEIGLPNLDLGFHLIAFFTSVFFKNYLDRL